MRFVDIYTTTNDCVITRNLINFVHSFVSLAVEINRSASLFNKDIFFS